MKKISKNESVRYQLYNHASKVVDGKYYCRAVNDLLNADIRFCNDCPLYGGRSIDENNTFMPQCFYFDIVNGFSDYMSPKEQKERMYGLITAGLATHFPEYIEDDERGKRFALIEQAIIYAGNAHVGRHRKGTHMPYIIHPMETMMITAHLTDDIDTIAAAALHDVVEDTEYTYEDIRLAFGEKVARLVAEESEDKREGQDKALTWRVRKEETIASTRSKSLEAKKIMLADKLSNLRASRRDYRVTGLEMWNKFNMKDPSQQKWYYTSVLEVLEDLKDTPEYEEAEDIIREIFHEVV